MPSPRLEKKLRFDGERWSGESRQKTPDMQFECENSPREDRQQPVFLIDPENLLEVFLEPEMESILVGTTDVEDWSSESFQGCSILEDEIDVVSEERH
jgi:hypothetical protein